MSLNQKALSAIETIKANHGKGSINRLGDKDVVPVEVIPTGNILIDIASGVGGFPRGRVIEISGPESGGKTTLTLQVIAEAQRLGGQAAFIDAEHALDVVYAQGLGVNVDDLVLSQPDNGEQALEIAQELIKSNSFDVIVIDSVSALVPKSELEGDFGDAQMGLQARLMSQAMRKLTGVLSKSDCILIFINQIREKIGVMFGNPETTSGGRALKFAATMRIDVRKGTAIKEGETKIGCESKISFNKNKVATPFRIAEPNMIYGKGFAQSYATLIAGEEAGVLTKSGAWFNYGPERIGQGKKSAAEFLEKNPEILNKILTEIRKKTLPNINLGGKK